MTDPTIYPAPPSLALNFLANAPPTFLAIDTETSGLHVDDGARLSIVSCAWAHPDHPDHIACAVFPFDQGVTDLLLGPKRDIPWLHTNKRVTAPLRSGQPALFTPDGEAAPNLPPHVFPQLCDALARHHGVYQNAKFDLNILRAGLRDSPIPAASTHRGFDLSPSFYWDTQVINPLLWPDQRTSLKPTAERLFPGVDTSQGPLLEWLARHFPKNNPRYDCAPWSLIEPYAGSDAVLTLRLFQLQSSICSEDSRLSRLARRYIEFARVLYRMERRGVGFDVSAASSAADKCWSLHQDAIDRIRKIFDEHGYVGNVTEPGIRDFWFTDRPGALNLTPLATTDAGNPSVTKDVVRTLVARSIPAAAEWQEYAQLETAYSMWYGTWLRQVGEPDPLYSPRPCGKGEIFGRARLRTSFRQGRTAADARGPTRYGDLSGGTVSGRLAVERVQLHAIPHDYQLPSSLPTVRSFFVPEPGNALFEIDLNQAEMRVATGVSNCRGMREAIDQGLDLHAATAMRSFNVNDSHPDWTFLRNVAKRLNFGTLYGAGVATIRNQILIFTGQDVPEEVVYGWLQDYRKAFPEFRRASYAAQAECDATRCVRLVSGRLRWFNQWENSHKAFNARIQGGVAESMTEAMVEIEAAYPGVMLLQIHDSLVGECARRQESSVTSGIATILSYTFERNFKVPFRCDLKEFH